MRVAQAGFTAVEMMVVIAVIGILAMIAIPSSMGKIIKEQVNAAMPLADSAKAPIAVSWAALKVLPAGNKEAGLPVPELVVSNFVSALEVRGGVINMTFGNKAHAQLKGKILSFRPAVIEESQVVPVAWVCGNAKAPEKMVVKGENKTNVADTYLPFICR
ncbi:MAG TPA: pilin [Methylophilaceae bacterium]|nr:pilin [Methylophilaceae bacterium]